MSAVIKRKPREYNLRSRVYFVLAVLALCATALFVRAVDLQVLRKDFYQAQGDARFLREVPIPAYRGNIVDRNGEPLAISTPMTSVWANPQEVLKHRDRLPELAAALAIDADSLVARLDERGDREFVYLKRHLSPQDAEQILALGVPGVNGQREFRRYYPAGEVFAHVIGFTDIDDRGQEGLELAFQDWLAGRPGLKRVIRDRRGRVVENVEMVREAEPGHELQLSLDRRLQYLSYRELKRALTEHQASSGSVVILDVATGEVLAMVNQPSYNPNARASGPVQARRNRAVTDVFEPGSVIKPFTVAAALESGRFTRETEIDTTPGTLKVGSHLVRDINNFGLINVERLLTKSSNVGAVRLAQQIESDHLWDMFHRFGFGEVTGSGFPGEAPGFLPPADRWREIEKATLSYGYGLNVTALQIASAYVALANGGRLRPPTFVKGTRNPDSAVIDPEIADDLTDMLRTVTGPDGSARRASISHYTVAGKTGTSRRASVGGYEKRYISLFAGMVPSHEPKYVAAIVINDPKGEAYYGGLVAAPVFSSIMGGAMRLMNVAPDAFDTLLAQESRRGTAYADVPLELDPAAEAVEGEVQP